MTTEAAKSSSISQIVQKVSSDDSDVEKSYIGQVVRAAQKASGGNDDERRMRTGWTWKMMWAILMVPVGE